MKIKHGYDCGMHVETQDVASSIVESRLVPKDLSPFGEIVIPGSYDYVYVDSHGEPKKLAISSIITGGGIAVVDVLPTEATAGQLAFLRLSNGLFKLHQYTTASGWVEMKVASDSTITSFTPTNSISATTVQTAVEEIDSKKADTNSVYTKTETQDTTFAANAGNTAYKTMGTTNVQDSLEYLFDAIGTGGTGNIVNVTQQTTPELGNEATYVVTQGGTQVGTKINIPISKTTSQITVTQTLGGYTAGDVIPTGTDFTEILDTLLSPSAPVGGVNVYYGLMNSLPTTDAQIESLTLDDSKTLATLLEHGYTWRNCSPNNQYIILAIPADAGIACYDIKIGGYSTECRESFTPNYAFYHLDTASTGTSYRIVYSFEEV